ncbi:MAG: YwqG family protein [Microthrixaceae bacterium]
MGLWPFGSGKKHRSSQVPPEAAALVQRLLAAAPVLGPSLVGSLRPAVRYRAEPGESAELGRSRYGGDPDIGPGTRWPYWNTPDGESRPLRFFAQVDLAEAQRVAPVPLELPVEGLLSFFVDLDQQGDGITGLYSWHQPGSTVIYTPRGTPLVRLASPVETLPTAMLEAVGRWTWPTQDFDPFDEEVEALEELDHQYEREVRGLPPNAPVDSGRHQLGGHPVFIQHPVEQEVVQALAGMFESSEPFDEARWERLKDQTESWRLLLQIDSDSALDAMWGDVGTIYWMARQQDIAVREWGNGMFNLQCH